MPRAIRLRTRTGIHVPWCQARRNGASDWYDRYLVHSVHFDGLKCGLVTRSPSSRVLHTMDTMTAVFSEPMVETRPTSFDMPTEQWRQIFAALADGDRGSLELVYDVAAARLYGFALWATGSSDDASDVVADVFLKLAERRDQLGSVRNPRSWLLTVTRRLTIDLARQRRRRPAEPLEAAAFLTAPSYDRDRRIDARRAGEFLARLPERQREVVYLRHFSNETFASIARITGVPTFTAASRYRLALRRLRHLMENPS